MEYDKPFVLGIDSGTGSIRVGIFDIKGRPVAFSSKEYSTTYPRPGWAEQDPDEWWESLVEAAHEAIEKSRINSDDIVAIGVDGTSSTVVCMGKNLKCLRSAILWMDNRSAVQAQKYLKPAILC